jgi:hypothetical protein
VVYSLLAEARKKHMPVTAGQRSSPAARPLEQIRYAAAGRRETPNDPGCDANQRITGQPSPPNEFQ